VGENGLTSLLFFLAFGLFFYWMMKKRGCSMHGHGGHNRAGHVHADPAGPDARHGDVTGSTKDPVYGMPLDPNRAVGMRAFRDRSFYLSSAYCPKFDAHPNGIASRARAEGSRAEHGHD
jgi:hypothetical protein